MNFKDLYSKWVQPIVGGPDSLPYAPFKPRSFANS